MRDHVILLVKEFNPNKWQKLANSLRMRYAMRLSVVDPVTAEKEFREASEGLNVIKAQDEIFAVPENNGWDNLTGVFTASFDDQSYRLQWLIY